MNFSYHSGFAGDIQSMIEFKAALGHKSETYQWNLRNFDRFCQRMFPKADILTQEIVFAWCNEIGEDCTSGYRLNAMRVFGNYLLAFGKEAYVLGDGFRRPKNKGLPYIFTDDELHRFFRATDEESHDPYSPLLEYIVPVIFRLQFGCGLRPQEVRLLKRCEVNFEKGSIYISDSKGHKDRRLPISPELMELCRNYDFLAGLYYPGRLYFFPSPCGDAYKPGWLTKQFHICWSRAGLGNAKGSSTPYALRHNFATRTLMKWVEEGRDLDTCIPYLSTYMGHASFHSTYYYIHLLPERLSHMDFVKTEGTIPEVDA